jgi:uncharacterized BrkB/YihY/UPF0761 family membrane protein
MVPSQAKAEASSEALWRIFGLYAYFGMFGGLLLGLILLVVSVRRRHRRQRPTLV